MRYLSFIGTILAQNLWDRALTYTALGKDQLLGVPLRVVYSTIRVLVPSWEPLLLKVVIYAASSLYNRQHDGQLLHR